MKRVIKFRAWDNVNNLMETNVQQFDSFNEILVKDKYDVMEFTGLKDKNGIEIYEGDIAIFSGVKCVVKWNTNFCGFTLNGTDKKISFWSIRDCDVIGNIYES